MAYAFEIYHVSRTTNQLHGTQIYRIGKHSPQPLPNTSMQVRNLLQLRPLGHPLRISAHRLRQRLSQADLYARVRDREKRDGRQRAGRRHRPAGQHGNELTRQALGRLVGLGHVARQEVLDQHIGPFAVGFGVLARSAALLCVFDVVNYELVVGGFVSVMSGKTG